MKLKRKTLIITVVVITIVIIISGCLLLTNKGNNEIIGFWTIDGYTNYEFLENDKGNLVLPHKKMEFTYKIKDNTTAISTPITIELKILDINELKLMATIHFKTMCNRFLHLL